MMAPARPRTSSPLIAAFGLVLTVTMGVLVPKVQFTAVVLTALACAYHVLLLTAARRITGRVLSGTFFVAVLWIVYFPIRLLVIQADRQNFTLHPTVAQATDADLLWVWCLSGLGLSALLAGSWLVTGRRQGIALDLPATRSMYACITAGGLAITVLLPEVGISSGLLAQVKLVTLFGLAGLGFIDGRSGGCRPLTAALVAVGVFLGAMQGFKELAVLPIAAWCIGLVAGSGRQFRVRRVLATLLVAVVAYAGVQGQRIAGGGHSPASLLTSSARALADHDLRSSTPHHPKRGFELFTNFASGLSQRFYGADILLVLRDKVPSSIPYQHGVAIIDPTLSVVPGITRLVDLTYPTLSLGGFVTARIYSVNPNSDPSAQILTWPGDLYLNFGLAGVVVGLLLIGAGLGVFDRLTRVDSPFGCALFVYVGLSFVRLESNVAYALVTGLMRLVTVLAVVLVVSQSRAWRDQRADGPISDGAIRMSSHRQTGTGRNPNPCEEP